MWWYIIAVQSSHFYHFFNVNHFYFPAQLVGGFTLSDLLDKPWSQVGVASLLPPVRAFNFIAHRVQLVEGTDTTIL